MAYQTVPRELPEQTVDRTVAGGPVYEAAKRAFDVGVSVAALVLTAPIWIVVSLLLWNSPGPIIFRQTRCGKDGRPFTCYKFRTMVDGAERLLAENEQLQSAFEGAWKLKEDPRITRLGAFLRRTSIDELPQLINVIRGEMSIVGPRPVQPGEISLFGHWGESLIRVRPGITGLWQVSGRSLVPYDERIALDVEYLRRRGFWFDLGLIVRTIPVVLSTRGAI